MICDTKFELGYIDGRAGHLRRGPHPDSSRFWPAADCAPGHRPRPRSTSSPCGTGSEAQPWDKQPPPPPLPDEIVTATSRRYTDAYELISGRRLADWYGA